MSLGSLLPKLDRQHEKAWVLLTFPTCTQLIYSIQSHSRLIQPPVLPSTSLPATILSSPPPDDIHCQVCQSPFDEHKMLLCDICNAGWHVDCLLPPRTTIPNGTWKCPLCTPRHTLPKTVTQHLHLPSPVLDFDSDYIDFDSDCTLFGIFVADLGPYLEYLLLILFTNSEPYLPKFSPHFWRLFTLDITRQIHTPSDPLRTSGLQAYSMLMTKPSCQHIRVNCKL